MMPVQVKTLGTATSTVIYPDICQNPFQIGIGVSVQTGGVTTAGLSIEHCFDYRTVYSPSFNGATALVDGSVQTAVWFASSGISQTTVTTGGGLDSNYAFATPALRLNVLSATATTIVVANFVQSVNSP
jgi:hypothetical protein